MALLLYFHPCSAFFFFPAVFHAILIPFIPFQQMSDECYDKTFIPNIIDSSHLLWKGSVHWSARWDRCLISVYSDFLKMSSDHVIASFKEARRCSDQSVSPSEEGGRCPAVRRSYHPDSSNAAVMKQICSSRQEDSNKISICHIQVARKWIIITCLCTIIKAL